MYVKKSYFASYVGLDYVRLNICVCSNYLIELIGKKSIQFFWISYLTDITQQLSDCSILNTHWSTRKNYKINKCTHIPSHIRRHRLYDKVLCTTVMVVLTSCTTTTFVKAKHIYIYIINRSVYMYICVCVSGFNNKKNILNGWKYFFARHSCQSYRTQDGQTDATRVLRIHLSLNAKKKIKKKNSTPRLPGWKTFVFKYNVGYPMMTKAQWRHLW